MHGCVRMFVCYAHVRVHASTHAYLQAYACTHGSVQARVGGARQARDALTKLHPTPELNPQPIGRVQARVGGARQALRLALLVEDGVWPEYTLYEAGTWMAHRKELGRRTHARVRGRGVAIYISIYTDMYMYVCMSVCISTYTDTHIYLFIHI